MILFGRVVDIRGWLRRKLRLQNGSSVGSRRFAMDEGVAGTKEKFPEEYHAVEWNMTTLLLASFLLGVVVINLCGVKFAQRMEGLSTEGLIALRDAKIDGKVFVRQLLLRRGLLLCGIIGVSMARSGKWICRLITAWLGFAMGGFFAALLLLYGLKGQFLGLVWCLPQGILYGPAFLFLMKWCVNLPKMIGKKHSQIQSRAGRTEVVWKMAELVGILLMIFLGCLLEGYLNPLFLQSYLRHF